MGKYFPTFIACLPALADRVRLIGAALLVVTLWGGLDWLLVSRLHLTPHGLFLFLNLGGAAIFYWTVRQVTRLSNRRRGGDAV